MSRYIVRPKRFLGAQVISTPQIGGWLAALTESEKAEGSIVSVDSVADSGPAATVITVTLDDGTGPVQNTVTVTHGDYIVLEGWLMVYTDRDFSERYALSD